MSSKKVLSILNKSDRIVFKNALEHIQSYIVSRDGLKELNVLRSDRTLQSDYAEWLISKMYNLSLSDNPVEAGFDAKDSVGKRYQIKCRVVKSFEQNTSFDFKELNNGFDYFLGVFFTSKFELIAVIKVKYKFVKELGTQNKGRISFRWNSISYKDSRIERLF